MRKNSIKTGHFGLHFSFGVDFQQLAGFKTAPLFNFFREGATVVTIVTTILNTIIVTIKLNFPRKSGGKVMFGLVSNYQRTPFKKVLYVSDNSF